MAFFVMKTKSSRLFVVLIHLVGVSTRFSQLSGVNPNTIILKNIPPSALEVQDGNNNNNNNNSTEDQLWQSQWLQDTSSQYSCLSPLASFSECGDATLWRMVPRSKRHFQRNRWISWATEEEPSSNGHHNHNASVSVFANGFALQWVTDEAYPSSAPISNTNTSSSSSTHILDWSQQECLSRRRKDRSLILIPCSSDKAWNWHFTTYSGVLYYQSPHRPYRERKHVPSSSFASLQRRKRGQEQDGASSAAAAFDLQECLYRNASQAVLAPCSSRSLSRSFNDDDESMQVVPFALVRQALVSHAPAQPSEEASQEATPTPEQPVPILIQEESPATQHIPHSATQDKAHTQAKASSSASAKPGQRVDAHQKAAGPGRVVSMHSNAQKTQDHQQQQPPWPFHLDNNPILIADRRVYAKKKKSKGEDKKTPSSDIRGAGADGAGLRRRRSIIQRHPYLESAKNEVWTDPQTGLQYHTDLRRYLGHDSQESGRHTLTGVGQYTRTVFNIKVYGVAFYVAKRDVLADAAMTPYASMSIEELRQDESFYRTMRRMATPTDQREAGSFDRTLLIKTNMQLSAETMTASLDADWQYLTPENKALLIGSSLKPRPASENMLKVIQSDENPSRCSCSQVAPPEYQADPTCCARGTELVFTWRKNGNLEIRLNGDLMDIFPRPDVASGIFYEYLRTDNPMSMEFLDRVLDGIPFLLAPLAQVKGVSSATPEKSSSHQATSNPPAQNAMVSAIISLPGMAFSQAMNMASMMQQGASQAQSRAIDAAEAMGGMMRDTQESMEKKRVAMTKRVFQMADQAMSVFMGQSSRNQQDRSIAYISEEYTAYGRLFHGEIPLKKEPESWWHALLDKLLSLDSQTPPADEITPMIHSSRTPRRQIFVGLVHMYLLLLMLSSFPTDIGRRMVLIIRRKSTSSSGTATTVVEAVSDSEDESSSASDSFSRTSDFLLLTPKKVSNTKTSVIMPTPVLPNLEVSSSKNKKSTKIRRRLRRSAREI